MKNDSKSTTYFTSKELHKIMRKKEIKELNGVDTTIEQEIIIENALNVMPEQISKDDVSDIDEKERAILEEYCLNMRFPWAVYEKILPIYLNKYESFIDAIEMSLDAKPELDNVITAYEKLSKYSDILMNACMKHGKEAPEYDYGSLDDNILILSIKDIDNISPMEELKKNIEYAKKIHEKLIDNLKNPDKRKSCVLNVFLYGTYNNFDILLKLIQAKHKEVGHL